MTTKVNAGIPAYIGEFKNQKRHGFGIYRYPNTFFQYEGEWKDGKKHGHGKLIMADDSYYEGQFKDGEINGIGVRKWSYSGNMYNGQFVDGEMTGKGVMKYGNGTEYDGEWEGNTHEGKGILSFEDGSIYKGEFYKHKRHGQGIHYHSNDENYDGEWVGGHRQGHGVMKFINNSIYSGQWQFDMFNGHGTLISAHGASYEGQWINNTPEFEAKKLCICISSQPVEIEQGKPFDIKVECHTEDDEQSPESGRLLQITAGIKIGSQSKLQKLAQQTNSTPSDLSLVDIPFGFNVVPYPITTFAASKVEIVTSPADKQDMTCDTVQDRDFLSSTPEEIPLAVTSNTEGQDNDVCQCDEAIEKVESVPEKNKENDQDQQHQQHINTFLSPSSMTVNGEAYFQGLFLPPAPSLQHHLSPEAKDGRQTATRNKRGSAQLDAKPKKEKKEQKSTKDEKLCKTGDYVIVVKDVTDPPFLDVRLQTAYMHIKVISTIKKTKSKTDQR